MSAAGLLEAAGITTEQFESAIERIFDMKRARLFTYTMGNGDTFWSHKRPPKSTGATLIAPTAQMLARFTDESLATYLANNGKALDNVTVDADGVETLNEVP